jgi:hypothetical protein
VVALFTFVDEDGRMFYEEGGISYQTDALGEAEVIVAVASVKWTRDGGFAATS